MNIPSSIRPTEINGITHLRQMFKELVDILKNYEGGGGGESQDLQPLINDINTILSYIPEQTTDTNTLADKEFVNSSIATNTATFRGTVISVSSLPTENVDENDYAFVIDTDEAGNTLYKRYKYANNVWTYEYTLNNSSFTAAQWAAIQSGITAAIVANLHNSDKLVRSNAITDIRVISQSDYDALTPQANVEYNIIES